MERLLYLYELLHKANNKVEVTCSSSDSDSAAMNSDSIGSRNYTRFANPLLSFKQKKNWAVGGVDGHSKSLNRPLIHSTTTVRPANVMASAVSSSPTTNTAPISALQKAVGGRGGAKGGNTVHPEGEAGAGPGPGDGGIGWGEWLWQSIVSSK